MRGIGYWRNEHEEEFHHCPLPQSLVDRSWHGAERTLAITYLTSGRVYEMYRGYSYCRFRCGIESSLMGASDVTDGTWVWPRGLAHYIETHAVILPDEFIAHCKGNNWAMPEWEGTPAPLDLAWWIAWSRAQSRCNGA